MVQLEATRSGILLRNKAAVAVSMELMVKAGGLIAQATVAVERSRAQAAGRGQPRTGAESV